MTFYLDKFLSVSAAMMVPGVRPFLRILGLIQECKITHFIDIIR